jgi:hypothetical protein
MALQADEAHFLPGQHAWIGRAMRFMTRTATLKPHCGVLERKGTALIPMAVETPRFVGSERLHHRRANTAVRIMAIDAGHGAFGQLMVIRPLKLRPDVEVTARALVVDGGGLADHQVMAAIRVNLMTGRAGNLVLHVTALETPYLRRLVQVATEADLVGCGGRQFAGIADIRRRSRFCVFLPGTVAGFTGPSFEAMSLAGFERVVRTLLKGLENIFVAGPAKLRTGVAGRKRGLTHPAAGREKEDCPARTQVNIAHAPGQQQKRHRHCDKLCMLRRATWCSKACVTLPGDLHGNPNRLRKLPGLD